MTPPALPVSSLSLPDEWAESAPPPVSLSIAEYWTLLDDPLLTEFVIRAIAANRDIAQGAARLDQARAAVRSARAGYLPSASASGGIGRDLGTGAPGSLQYSLGSEASWEMDLFGQISGNVRAAEADFTASGYSLADLQRLIVGEVAINTINARATAEQLRIARETLAYQDENLQIAQWRNQAGLVSSLDVEQARAQRAQTAATIPSLQSQLAATANSISTLIGEPPGRAFQLLEAPGGVPMPAEISGFEAPAEVIARRPDVRAAEASLLAATARIGVARAQMLPLVRLTGSIGTASVGIDDLFKVITGTLFAGVNQLLFDGGRSAAQVDSAQAAARGELAAWEQAILSALEEVESAAVAQRAAAERVRINTEGLDAANNSALLARSQYQAGLTDFQTLLSAENQLLSAHNQLLSAEADRATAFVRLTQALGGGWSPQVPMAANGIDGVDE